MIPESVSVNVLLLSFVLLGGLSLGEERARQGGGETSGRGSQECVCKVIGPKRVVGVDLSGMTGTDEVLAQMHVCTRLRSLNLEASDVTDAGMAHLKKFASSAEFVGDFSPETGECPGFSGSFAYFRQQWFSCSEPTPPFAFGAMR